MDKLDTLAEKMGQLQDFDEVDMVEESHCPLEPLDLVRFHQIPYGLEDPLEVLDDRHDHC